MTLNRSPQGFGFFGPAFVGTASIKGIDRPATPRPMATWDACPNQAQALDCKIVRVIENKENP